MRFAILVIMLALLAMNANASWQTYQHDLRNTGLANGSGYFPAATANYSLEGVGMNFQPLVGDLDGNGNNEIIIFSDGSLMILSPQLDILSQKKVGAALGQPALFDFDNDNFIDIIFNSHHGIDYFFAYSYNNSELTQEFNITLSRKANFSGIKCLDLNGTNTCVFKDMENYVHVVNMESKEDNSYYTSASNESLQTSPAIGDLDNDGTYEAVFWHNNDSGGGYGFLVFDINERKIDWSNDNIFSPFINSFELKGNPVLADLNNDGNLEIAASVFYDDSISTGTRIDWFTELFVYDANGTKLFSACELNTVLNNYCNDASGESSKWEGTNPFVMKVDNADRICFIKDRKINGFFKNMTISCYNYSGNAVLDSAISLQPEDKKSAIAADMDNDGKSEVIVRRYIYSSDGKLLFDIGELDYVAPIAADMDGNTGLDIIWTYGNTTKTFLDSNNYTMDLEAFDINFLKLDGEHVNVTAVIRNNGQFEARNVKAAIYNYDTKENSTFLLDVRRNGNLTISASIGLKKHEKALVSADYNNEINETNEGNNDIVKEFMGFPYVYVTSRQDEYNVLSFLEPVFIDYIKKSLVAGYFTDKESEADVKVYIGKDNPSNKNNNPSLLNEFGYGYGEIYYYDSIGLNPYSGLVVGYKDDGLFGSSVKVMIVGNEIEGEIAALKEFIKNQELFLNVKGKKAVFVSDENEGGVKVYDYLNNDANKAHYNELSNEFKTIVSNALNDEMFSSTDKTVMTPDGISLRLRNLKANFSDDFILYLNSSGIPTEFPVVLSRGIHSNLTSWETLAGELANEGRDAWLIEITGGPGQDCDDCPNYNFSDLTGNYWPTIVNGILNLTGKEKIQYVGHSNGGRVAIVSLADGKVNPGKIDTLIGVAVPSAFEGYSTFGNYFGKYGEQIMNELSGKGHVSMTEIGDRLRSICKSKFEFSCRVLTFGLKSDNKMSFNVDKQLYLWVINESDSHIGKDLNLNNFYIIQGYVHNDQSNNVTHDFIVTEQDEKGIYGNIISSNKKHYKIWGAHTAGWSSASLPDREITKSIIKDALNKKSLNKYKSNEINST